MCGKRVSEVVSGCASSWAALGWLESFLSVHLWMGRSCWFETEKRRLCWVCGSGQAIEGLWKLETILSADLYLLLGTRQKMSAVSSWLDELLILLQRVLHSASFRSYFEFLAGLSALTSFLNCQILIILFNFQIIWMCNLVNLNTKDSPEARHETRDKNKRQEKMQRQ